MTTETQSTRAGDGNSVATDRAAFEAKFGKHQKWCDPEVVAQLDQPLCETLVGKYLFNDIQKAWEAWQAGALAAAPAAAPAAPLTEDDLLEAFCKARHSTHYASVYIAGARFAERAHGILTPATGPSA